MSTDPFWEMIDDQLSRIINQRPHSYQQLAEILSTQPGISSADAFFAGSGGDAGLDDALLTAGWRFLHCENSYHYSMVSPNGEKLTYVEGDIYPGDHFADQNA